MAQVTETWALGSEQVTVALDVELSVDGISDQTAFLQAFIDAAPDGTEANPSEVNLPTGTFRLDGQLLMSDREWLVVDAGTGINQCRMVRQVEGERGSAHIRIEGCRDLTWLGGRVEGFATAYDADGIFGQFVSELEGQHGLIVKPIGSTDTFHVDCERILIEDFECRDVFGDFVYIGGLSYGPQGQKTRIEPSDVTIRRLLGEKNGRQGVGSNGVTRLIVEDSTIMAKRTGVDLENVLSGSIDGVIIRRNAIRTSNGMVNAQSSNPRVNNVLIEDNVAYGPAIRCRGNANTHRFNWKVLRNIWPGPDTYIKDTSTERIWFQRTDHIEIRDNYLRVGLKEVHNRNNNGALLLCDVDDVSIIDNDFRGENQLINVDPTCPVTPTNVVESGNTGIWEGPIPTHAPYPPGYDPNVDRRWFPADFPNLYPTTPFATAGFWDSLPRGAGLR